MVAGVGGLGGFVVWCEWWFYGRDKQGVWLYS